MPDEMTGPELDAGGRARPIEEHFTARCPECGGTHTARVSGFYSPIPYLAGFCHCLSPAKSTRIVFADRRRNA